MRTQKVGGSEFCRFISCGLVAESIVITFHKLGFLYAHLVRISTRASAEAMSDSLANRSYHLSDMITLGRCQSCIPQTHPHGGIGERGLHRGNAPLRVPIESYYLLGDANLGSNLH
jgi:hypothetical protein